MSATNSNTYRVEEMSCGHCEAAIGNEVAKVSDVQVGEIDLGSKQVSVQGDVEDAAVRAAIAAAGYEAA